MPSNQTTNNVAPGCNDGVCVPRSTKEETESAKSAKFDVDDDDMPSPVLVDEQEDKAMTSNKIKIDIISDTMCPWCYVGKRNLEQAMLEMPNVDAEISWLPFFLNKDLPDEGMPVRDYFLRNYGDPNAGERMKPALVNAGRRSGIDFETNHIGITHYRPTIRSHRLIELAKRQDNQDEMVMELFHMYFEEGKDLNSIEDLTVSAKKVGIEGDIEAYLKSDEDEAEVFAEAARVSRQASGVPTFLFSKPGTDLTYSFSGGQPPSAFKQVFEAFE